MLRNVKKKTTQKGKVRLNPKVMFIRKCTYLLINGFIYVLHYYNYNGYYIDNKRCSDENFWYSDSCHDIILFFLPAKNCHQNHPHVYLLSMWPSSVHTPLLYVMVSRLPHVSKVGTLVISCVFCDIVCTLSCQPGHVSQQYVRTNDCHIMCVSCNV